MERKRFILIAPHSMCYESIGRICDKNAWNGLVAIERHLENISLPHKVISRTDVPRSVVDVNR